MQGSVLPRRTRAYSRRRHWWWLGRPSDARHLRRRRELRGANSGRMRLMHGCDVRTPSPTDMNEKIVPVLASKKEHTRLSKSAPATATRLTVPRHKCSPNRVQAHTLRLFSPKHSVTPLPPCQSELDSPRLPPASAARLLWTSSAAPRGREGVCPGREVARPRTANPV